MDLLTAVLTWLGRDVLGVQAYLVGVLTLVALASLRRRPGEIVVGTLKATLGFIILGIGADAVVSAMNPLGALITSAFGVSGLVPSNEAIAAIANRTPAVAQNAAIAMCVGVALSVLLARLTPLRYVFLGGQHMLAMATLLTLILAGAGASDALQIVVPSIGLATMTLIAPAFSMPWMTRVSGGVAVAMGHFGTLGYIAAGLTGSLVGRGSRSTEDLRIPSPLRFVREPIVGAALALILLYLVLAISGLARLGESVAFRTARDATGGATGGGGGGAMGFLTVMLQQALVFGAGVAVILLGVRLILAEIIPAFAGIAARIIPGAVPALDCPMVFPYAPTAVVVGFLASLAGGVVGLGILWAWLGAAFAVPLILPGMVPHFFTGGTAGVFGNATGGRRGAVGGGFVNGLLITILAALLVPALSSTGGQAATVGDADLLWFGIALGRIATLGDVAAAAGMVGVCALLLAVASWWQVKVVNTGWVPGRGRPPARSQAHREP